MTTRLGRTVPPAAAPVPAADVLRALPACFGGPVDGGRFEEDLQRFFGQPHCLLVSSGQAALVAILAALREVLPDRTEVVVPAYTCYTVPAAVRRAGLEIRLCDTGPGSLDLDQAHLERIIESDRGRNRILCVLMTHLFGCPADHAGLRAVVGDSIPVVEDAAQAMGLEAAGARMGTLGDAGFFSLGRGKALSTMGGGVILTGRSDLGEILRRSGAGSEAAGFPGQAKLAVQALAMALLQRPELFWIPRSLPFLKLGETIYEEHFPIGRLAPFQERLGTGWRVRLSRHEEARSRNCRFWRDQAPPDELRHGVDPGELGLIRYPLLLPSVEERERVLGESHEAGCGLMPTYPLPVHRIPELADAFAGQEYPNAQALSERLITLPTHEYLRDGDRARILKILRPA